MQNRAGASALVAAVDAGQSAAAEMLAAAGAAVPAAKAAKAVLLSIGRPATWSSATAPISRWEHTPPLDLLAYSMCDYTVCATVHQRAKR